MVEVKITEDIKIGGNNPCFIIAEVGQNHQGDIELAKKLMKAAKVSVLALFADKAYCVVHYRIKTKETSVFLRFLPVNRDFSFVKKI